MFRSLIIAATLLIYAHPSCSTPIFKCLLNPLHMHPGGKIYIPDNSTIPLFLPSNFNCTYWFLVPKGSYLKVTVITSFVLNDAEIKFKDALGYEKIIKSADLSNEQMFSTVGTGSVTVTTKNAGKSKALIEMEWIKLPHSNRTEYVYKEQNGKYIGCDELQGSPVTFSVADVNETLAISIAHSGYIMDDFDSFFIFSGNDTDSHNVQRLSFDTIVPLRIKGQFATIVGFSRRIITSDLIINLYSNIKKYHKYTAAVIADKQSMIIDANNQTSAVTFIAKQGEELFINELSLNEVEMKKCNIRVMSGTPSVSSKFLVQYTNETDVLESFPQLFPSPTITVEITDCSIYIVLTNNIPDNFYRVTNNRIGYVFTPSYLDNNASSTLNFTLYSTQSMSYSTKVESVNVEENEELEINVYTIDGMTAMSIVVTGNETGGGAEAYGTLLNIRFNGSSGQGAAKILYRVSVNSNCLLSNSWVIGFVVLFYLLILN